MRQLRLWEGSVSGALKFGISTFLIGSVLACGGGGGGDDSNPVNCTSLSFGRALATPTPGDVYMDQAGSSCSTIDVNILVSNLSGIFTAGFDLTYPSAVLAYQSYTLGPLLQKGGPATPPFVILTPSPGVLEVTMTRFGPDAPVSASGSEGLIVLHFRRIAAGVGMIDFNTGGGSAVSESILDDNGVARPALFAPGHGGMVTAP